MIKIFTMMKQNNLSIENKNYCMEMLMRVDFNYFALMNNKCGSKNKLNESYVKTSYS